jgi:hypothetical protein
LRVNVYSCLIYYHETHVCQYIVLAIDVFKHFFPIVLFIRTFQD